MRDMQRAATFGLVAVVLALALAAGVDALRGEEAGVERDDSGRPEAAATTTGAETAEVSEADRRAIQSLANELLEYVSHVQVIYRRRLEPMIDLPTVVKLRPDFTSSSSWSYQ